MASLASLRGGFATACVTGVLAMLMSLRTLWCPPTLAERRIALLRVGDNHSSARLVALTMRWLPWRPMLADELHVLDSVVWDEDGTELRCAAEVRIGSPSLYFAPPGTPWQWPAEWAGHERKIRVPSLASSEWPEDGTHEEAGWEAAARAATVSPCSDEVHSRLVTLQTLSVSPPIFRIEQFLPEAMRAELLQHATLELEPSTVGDPAVATASDGTARAYRKRDERRTSHSAWIHGYNDPRRSLPAARAVQRAVRSLLRLPSALPRGIEPLLTVHYAPGQFYEPHVDFFDGEADGSYAAPLGSNRLATVIMYLNDVQPAGHGSADYTGGGHTVFPFAVPTANASALAGVSFAGREGAPSCDFPALHQRRGLLVQPRAGDALVFYDQLPDGSLDQRTRHGSCPVHGGSKTAVNVWAWNRDVIYR